MKYNTLKKTVFEINMGLNEAGLVTLTWGNASGVDRALGVMGIKPSGVSYETLQPSDIVIQSIETGEVIEGDLRPSSDSPTHLVLYRAFPAIGGVVHTHSSYATSWAQACREIPPFGTTHADHFNRPVPLTRDLTEQEIETAYEENTGRIIVERFTGPEQIDPLHVPGVLVPFHGPFTWGNSPENALQNAVALETIAMMAITTLTVNPDGNQIPQPLLNKHFQRKHGKNAYYGQK